MKTIRIGSGSAWMGDRVEPARWSAERGRLDYMCFETMAEVTISMAQVRKAEDPNAIGWDPYLDDRMEAVLPGCLKAGTRIVSNQGWVDPEGAADRIRWHLRRLGATGKKVAFVTGGVVTDRMDRCGPILETGADPTGFGEALLSAEAYLGARPIAQALAEGADIVVTGRCADPALFLGPMLHEFGWTDDDLDRLGAGAAIGPLMESAAQVTGGYFSDPGFKDVPEPWNLGFPIADVTEDGACVLGKLEGTGGGVTLASVKEQMLYEVHDPHAYATPDVVVDFSTAKLTQLNDGRVRIEGVSGKPRPERLKVSIGCREGYIGEDMFLYAGPGALDRAKLAKRILEERFRIVGLKADEVRIDFVGYNAVHGDATPADAPEPYEVAVRVAARTQTYAEAFKVGREVDGMAVSGVAMTGKRGGHRQRVREVVGVWSALIDRDAVAPEITILEV
ncbi:MAG: acyclic terpene utilization AtuA family protein [Pseudomonadota bacterium]|nr:acyclic terpene utilization AtuA family protein [Pseudomonadota bacterium]